LIPLRPVCALIGSTLFALLLCGSYRNAASFDSSDTHASSEVTRLHDAGKRFFLAADYSKAQGSFLAAANAASRAHDNYGAAMNWSNAGSCSLHTMQFGEALKELRRAREIAEATHQLRPLLFALNNLASLYIETGQFDQAIQIAREALNGPAGNADAGTRARLLCEVAQALAELKRFDEAVPYYISGINGLLDAGDLDGAARALGNFGNDGVTAGNIDEAEWALAEGLGLVRLHKLNASTNILSGLARLRGLQGQQREAATFFESALSAPPDPTPKWLIYKERGRFRLDNGEFTGALADYREARRIISRMRLEMVPADQDRVRFESGLGDVMEGLVDAGNRVARQTGDAAVLRETFDAAEQDRLWSLRLLVPTPNDWRARLPEHYWELLTQYQTLERAASAQSSPGSEDQLAQLSAQLQQIEANAAGESGSAQETTESPLSHAQSVLDADSVLLSFHISRTSSWVWAVDRQGVDVYPLPTAAKFEAETAAFARAVRDGAASAALGAQLYRDLFGAVSETYLRHRNWRLELDGPLYDLPFAALVAGQDTNGPVYLIQRAVLQAVPGALLLKHDAIPAGGALLAVGDPVYNTADARYHGKRGQSELTLPRLPNTASELEGCARAWNSPRATLLTGSEAGSAAVEAAIARNPAILHFATHVISGPGDFRSGLIALSLDSTGAMGLLGPKDIVARPIAAKLVVMNGCHSAQGQALPSAGLMGLTRAWIGAGASAVLATQWDVADSQSQTLITDFYRTLRASPERGAAYALREAQLIALKNRQPMPGWAAYSLLSRIP